MEWGNRRSFKPCKSNSCFHAFLRDRLLVINPSFAPNVPDIERLALRSLTQPFRSRADHLASVRSQPLQHSLPAVLVSLCRGSEQSTVFAPATMPAQSEQALRSFVLQCRLTNQPTPDWLCEP